MRFILYGHNDPETYASASRATRFRGINFGFVEMECDSVMIAFDGGGEVGRTYDMDKLNDWVDSVTVSAGEPPLLEFPGGAVQDPLPGLEYPPCR